MCSVVDKSKKKKEESSTIVSWCGFHYSIELQVLNTWWQIHAGGKVGVCNPLI